ncbi:MAG: hypothetical protein ABXS91_09220 [Sulfurimonas sp.]
MLKNILFTSLVGLAMVAFAGCTDSKDASASKCNAGKCDSAKEVKTKCGEGKCDSAKETTKKCGD